jgi:hypothetical protein
MKNNKTFADVKTEAYYQLITDRIENASEDICKANGCIENEHYCESYAYFNYDKTTKRYYLADICGSDYAQKCYASYIPLPFSGNAFDLFVALEAELLQEYREKKIKI